MKQSSDAVKAKSEDLIKLASEQHISPGPSASTAAELCELVQRCNSQFPSDIGLFVLFFLNFVKLTPGQAMYLKADESVKYERVQAALEMARKAGVRVVGAIADQERSVKPGGH